MSHLVRILGHGAERKASPPVIPSPTQTFYVNTSTCEREILLMLTAADALAGVLLRDDFCMAEMQRVIVEEAVI